MDGKYLCEFCGYILRDPVQLNCGHRLCKSCVDNQTEDIIICQECSETTSKHEIRLDRGFKKDMQGLNIICALCDWSGQLKDYDDHLDQYHSDSICEYCGKIFQSSECLSIHQRISCHALVRPCPLTDYGCSHELFSYQMEHHYLTEQHQFALLKAIKNLSNIQSENEHETVATQLQVNEIINSFTGGIQVLNDTVQQLNTNVVPIQDLLETLEQELSSHEAKIQEQNICLSTIESNQAILNQDLALIKQKFTDLTVTSYDDTLTWKVASFWEKIENLRSANPATICSPPFYTSRSGYKMCICLHLYGDDRGKYISLSLVLLQGTYDSVLSWPLNCRVSFCLYDQTPEKKHIIDSFRPDITSNSLQRPQSSMNIINGILKFCPLATIEQENSPYIQDDTIFIKVMIDFEHLPDESLPYMFSLNPGIPTHRQYKITQTEANGFHQRQ